MLSKSSHKACPEQSRRASPEQSRKAWNVIEAEAKRLGFCNIGCVEAAPVETAWAERYTTWLSQGCHAEMHYLENNLEKRLNPLLLMPEVKAILSVALPYHQSALASALVQTERNEACFDCRGAAKGRGEASASFIASYARGRDYHLEVKERLYELLHFMGCEGRVFVDTAPVMERYWAVKAGLGWIGRNGLLHVAEHGNKVFLGELFLTEMPLSVPVREILPCQCPPHCHACLDACPHRALKGDGTLDARECLSYLTIEHRGELPAWTAAPLHDCFFGCDRCIDACNVNVNVDANVDQERESWENLSREDFNRLFKDTAILRTKYEGLMRNILMGK